MHLCRWMERTALLSESTAALLPGDIAMLFQTIVGAWPLLLEVDDRAGCTAYCERLAAWQRKALREAKLATDWTCPNDAYETAARAVLEAIFADTAADGVLRDVFSFVHRIAPAGAVNSLAQVMLKFTAPGMPDLYQGTEFWDFSLVDPDNRQAVNFEARTRSLATPSAIPGLARDWRSGRIKQRLIRDCLAIRKENPRLFDQGEYIPLAIDGAAAGHIIAFARKLDDVAAITVVTRLATSFLNQGTGLTLSPAMIANGVISLPFASGGPYRNALTGADLVAADAGIPLGAALADMPVALLVTAR
jgi:maltooligosyltrehalose synthase